MKSILSSVVMVKSNSGSGSGIIVDQDIVATVCHIVNIDLLWGNVSVHKPDLIGKPEKEFPAVVFYRDPRRNVCLLSVPGISRDPDLHQVRIQMTSRKRKKGDRVIVVGTGGGESQFSDGHIIRLEEVSSGNCANDTIQEEGVSWQEVSESSWSLCVSMDIPVKPSWLGCPLYNRFGQVIGMLVGTSEDGDLHIAIPFDWINEVREVAVFQQQVISYWMDCLGDFKCEKNVIQEAFDNFVVPEKVLLGKGAVLAEWARELADRGSFEEAIDVTTDLSFNSRITALLSIAEAYVNSGDLQTAEIIFDQVISIILTRQEMRSMRSRRLLTIAETQARAGLLKKARGTYLAILEVLDVMDVKNLIQIESFPSAWFLSFRFWLRIYPVKNLGKGWWSAGLN